MDNNYIFLYWDDPVWGNEEDDQKPQKDPQHNSSQDQLNSDTFCSQYHNKNKSQNAEGNDLE
jgi:hypothetical protein